jgi:hypothetical protein
VTPSAIFDCMVFVQALANEKGPACACYELVRNGRLLLYVSPDVVAEAADFPQLTILEPPALLGLFPPTAAEVAPSPAEHGEKTER